jgi:hypothetical protein
VIARAGDGQTLKFTLDGPIARLLDTQGAAREKAHDAPKSTTPRLRSTK